MTAPLHRLPNKFHAARWPVEVVLTPAIFLLGHFPSAGDAYLDGNHRLLPDRRRKCPLYLEGYRTIRMGKITVVSRGGRR